MQSNLVEIDEDSFQETRKREREKEGETRERERKREKREREKREKMRKKLSWFHVSSSNQGEKGVENERCRIVFPSENFLRTFPL